MERLEKYLNTKKASVRIIALLAGLLIGTAFLYLGDKVSPDLQGFKTGMYITGVIIMLTGCVLSVHRAMTV